MQRLPRRSFKITVVFYAYTVKYTFYVEQAEADHPDSRFVVVKVVDVYIHSEYVLEFIVVSCCAAQQGPEDNSKDHSAAALRDWRSTYWSDGSVHINGHAPATLRDRIASGFPFARH
jgi:hypothetical protein